MPDPFQRPPKVAPKIKAAPSIRQLFWCDFPTDAQLPELWKRRPVVVLTFRNTLYGAVTVVPCSTDPQDRNKWAYKIHTQIDDHCDSWVICDKPTTVAVSRLSHDKSGYHYLTQDEYFGVITLVARWLLPTGLNLSLIGAI